MKNSSSRGYRSSKRSKKIERKRERRKARRSHKNHRIDLVVVRINNDGELRMSRPCDICVQTMLRYRVKRVFYTDNCGQLVCERVDQMGPSERSRSQTSCSVHF